MATSLKSFLPILSRILGESPDAIYERQRALMREGLLVAAAGRGPGSGIRATPDTIALLLIGMLASVTLSEAGSRARQMAAARPGFARHRCPLTGATTFAGVLAKVLSDEKISKRVTSVELQPAGGMASVRYDDTISLSFAPHPFPSESKIGFSASLGADTIHALTSATIALLNEDAQ